LYLQTAKAAIGALRSRVSDENRELYDPVIAHYAAIIERLELDRQTSMTSTHFEKEKRLLQYKAIQTGRDRIQALYEGGEVSRQDSVKLRHFMNQMEATTFEEEKVST
jgi:CPA1 family monovalent cation:H+ antiporter